jgi:hypothetical protein
VGVVSDHCICDGMFNSPNPDCPFHGIDPPVADELDADDADQRDGTWGEE